MKLFFTVYGGGGARRGGGVFNSCPCLNTWWVGGRGRESETVEPVVVR